MEENIESTVSLSDEIFADGLNSTNCAKSLVTRSIENLVKELFVLHEQTKNAQIKVTKSLDFL